MKFSRIAAPALVGIVAVAALTSSTLNGAGDAALATPISTTVVAEPAPAVPIPEPTPQLEFEPGTVAWFGDSLTQSSEATLVGAFDERFDDRYDLAVSSFGGTALCDWLSHIDTALSSDDPPAALVLSFYGNNFTPCMGAAGEAPGHAQGSSDFYDVYASSMDLVAARAAAAGVPVAWVQAPPRSPGVVGGPVEVRDALTELAADRGWPILEAGEALAGSDGGFAMWLPCSAAEAATAVCVDGQVKVRHDDLVHFEFGADGSAPGSQRWAAAAMDLLLEAASA